MMRTREECSYFPGRIRTWHLVLSRQTPLAMESLGSVNLGRTFKFENNKLRCLRILTAKTPYLGDLQSHYELCRVVAKPAISKMSNFSKK
ncbi:unnamed protein product, partial [Nesidiocoris tenuis]